MVTTITNPTSLQKLAQLTAYRYDQLNRIMQMRAYGDINLATNAWGSSAWTDMFKNTFSYGANGNLKTLQRYDSSGVIFDNFAYRYLETDNHLVQNRLYHINDTCANNRSAVDIDDQGSFSSTANTINTANNYGYDAIGNLMRDSTEQIANIEWTVYGKVKSITRDTNSIKPDLEFLYDPMGNRIQKITKIYNKLSTADSNSWTRTYYLRDAQGNIMATYTKKEGNTYAHLTDYDLYGSSRLGTLTINTKLTDYKDATDTLRRRIGAKQFELTNHLGNVLCTFSDRKHAKDSNTDGIIDYFCTDMKSVQDYYPFGMLMVSRNSSSNSYGFGMNGQLKDDEISNITGANYTAEYWEYDSRVGRRWNLDPAFSQKPWTSPYHAFSNKPMINVDPNGALDDWYENKETGEIKWFAREGEQGKTETIRGEKWTDLGTELLKFEGDKLTYFWQTKDDKGKLSLNKASWNSVSGKGVENSDDNLTFDYSKTSQNTDNGPIPEGLWYVQKSKVQYWKDQPWYDKAMNYVGKGDFPGGQFGWGENRWWIKPLEVNTERKNINGFTIHGGAVWGSHGCIDLTHFLPGFTTTFLTVSNSKNVVIWVDYSKISSIKVNKYQWGW